MGLLLGGGAGGGNACYSPPSHSEVEPDRASKPAAAVHTTAAAHHPTRDPGSSRITGAAWTGPAIGRCFSEWRVRGTEPGGGEEKERREKRQKEGHDRLVWW